MIIPESLFNAQAETQSFDLMLVWVSRPESLSHHAHMGCLRVRGNGALNTNSTGEPGIRLLVYYLDSPMESKIPGTVSYHTQGTSNERQIKQPPRQSEVCPYFVCVQGEGLEN